MDTILRPGNALVKDAQAIALEIASVENDDILRIVAEARAEDIEQAHGEAVAQQFADIALRGSMPVSSAGDQWLDSQEGKVTKGTVDGRRKVISQFTEDMGDLPISKVTPRVATTWLSNHLEPSGRSPKTLGRYIGAMELLWRWSRRREWCEGLSPFDGLTSELKKTKSKKRAFTDDEMKVFMGALSE